MHSNAKRTIAVATAAAFALTTFGVAPTFAASKSVKQTQVAPASEITDFSSRYRRYRNRAAGAAVLGAIIGGIATYAAAREYRKAREREYRYHYGYGYSPYYYGPRRHYRYW